jgi:hypothetical protein
MSAGSPRLAGAAVVAFVLGVGLMIPFESTVTRVFGIASLAAFVALGIAAIAEPRFLAGEDGDD